MAQIRWTAEAATWLEDIFNYIAVDNEDAARRTITDIYERVQNLQTFPRLGHLHQASAEGDIRVSLHGHYRIAYLLKQDETIVILGVFHGALEIERYL